MKEKPIRTAIRKLIRRVRGVDLAMTSDDEFMGLSLAYLTARRDGISESERPGLLMRIEALRKSIAGAPIVEEEDPA